ncbi:uncharacterized protein LOC143634472 [Bidens hawaiensis]|uniref:uncharacterized protein LOC143634472 n=1 Tax=Bidens hawaiensis TaxID=980011 RepID=UPI00404A9DA7
MADHNKQGHMDDFAKPSLNGYGSGVREPEITVSFEIKSSIIHMVENSVSFNGLSNEDPHSHVAHFLRLYATFKIQGCTDDAVRLRIFPFSLRGAALEWLEALPSGSITTWDQLVDLFLLQYFPPDKTARYRSKITSFRVEDVESLHAAWERFKGLLRKCPHHGLSRGLQCRTFFDALSGAQKQAVDQGSLPINTEINPNAEAKAITLRSGRSTIPIDASVSTPKPIADEIETETPSEVHPRVTPESTAQTSEPVRTYVPPIPYPGRLKKQKMEEQYGKFLELFKQLHINLPFIDALKEMPKYAKFLKEVLSNKKKLEEPSCVTLNEECSAVLQNKLPKKMADPGSFTIPCLIGSLSVSNALVDLGASINLMPYSVFAKLDLDEPKPTRMTIQLADRSVKCPRGIVESMLVKIDKFVFLSIF